MKVSQVMTRDAGTIHVEDSLKEAAETMRSRDLGCLPVLDPQLKVVGILTDRDICLTAGVENRPLSRIPVSAAMSREVYCCREDDGVEEAAEAMRKHAVRRLPVVDPMGKLAGVIALDDLAMEFLKEGSDLRNTLGGDRIIETLAEVCSRQVSGTASGSPGGNA